jgi:hypothetical protein
MKAKLLLLLLFTISVYRFELTEEEAEMEAEEDEEENKTESEGDSNQSSNEDSEEDSGEPKFWIDNGCIKSRPSLCPDGKCYADYSYCKPLEGCTQPKESLMCPSGLCVSDFDHCTTKSYKCPIESLNLCGDGVCRIDCKEILTNGCPPENPFYCPSGKCVKFAAQCIDYRCSFERPYLCNDLKCVPNVYSCATNFLSYMIKEVTEELLINRANKDKISYKIFSVYKNEKNILFDFENNYLMYNNFTAGYQNLSQKGFEEFEVNLSFKPVPRSVVQHSKVQYKELNLDTEKLTSLIFKKQYGYLQYNEFIRSSIIEFNLEDFDYNHFFFNDFPTFNFNYNKMDKFPDFTLTSEELKNLNSNSGISYNINDPSNYYCLGIYNKAKNEWICTSRKVISINENIISFKVATPGIYAVIYCPIESEAVSNCGLVCQYKKIFFSIILITIPVVLLIISFIFDNYGEEIESAKKKMMEIAKQGTKLVDVKNLKKLEKLKDITPLTKDDKKPLVESEDESEEDSDYEIIEEEKRDEIDPADIIDENFDVKGKIQIFANPLIFDQKATNGDQRNKADLEQEKINLKYKKSALLENKIKLLKKLNALTSEKSVLKKDIDKLKVLQGINNAFNEEDYKNDDI